MNLPKFHIHLLPAIPILILTFFVYDFYTKVQSEKSQNQTLTETIASQSALAALLQGEITTLESEDQRAKNKELSDTINQIKSTYKRSITAYDDLLDLKVLSKNTSKNTLKFDNAYAEIVDLLTKENYSSASAKIDTLTKDIATEKGKVTAAIAPVVANAPANNTPPGSGYSRQTVSSDAGNFVVSIVSADLGSTKVIVDTASDGSCSNNCPVLPLATYVSRSGAFAGINGSYFCPSTYPDCASKTNSFDLLVMNKNKVYFNSDNNVYSSNPGVIFGSGYIRFVSTVSQWGRDTGIDGMLSNYPLLVFNSSVNFGGNSDPKQGSKGNRSFVSNKGNTVYIGVVHSATTAEAARVLKAMGMENALNLDDGGSTALYSGGYKLGPGRDLPNAILFVKK
ncbi:MAG: phosphodiester glycosidase family protein [Patescibacteria group bacterium]